MIGSFGNVSRTCEIEYHRVGELSNSAKLVGVGMLKLYGQGTKNCYTSLARSFVFLEVPSSTWDSVIALYCHRKDGVYFYDIARY